MGPRLLGARRQQDTWAGARQRRSEVYALWRTSQRELGARQDEARSYGGKRNNWLLIKHRDQYAQDGDGAAVLSSEDRSVASGRTMAAIAAGKGRGAKPFMLAGKSTADPGAVWDSRKGLAAERRAKKEPTPGAGKGIAKRTKPKSSLKLPDFIAPQLCESVERPPDGSGWVHEIKFDGYRVQLRVLGGNVTLKTRKGLDWTGKFGAIADAAAGLPDGIIDGEIVALGANGVPDFAALQAALSEGKTKELIFFAFDLLFDGDEDLRKRPLSQRKRLLKQMFVDRNDRESHSLCRTFRHGRRGSPSLGLQAFAGRNRFEEA